MALKNTSLKLAIGSALAASLAAAPVSAGESPFAAHALIKGYMVAEAGEAKCGAMAKEGKCGGAMVKEGKCGGAKAKEGKCGGKKSATDAAANKKMMKEGKCGEGMCGAKSAKEGKCGEGKCGGRK